MKRRIESLLKTLHPRSVVVGVGITLALGGVLWLAGTRLEVGRRVLAGSLGFSGFAQVDKVQAGEIMKELVENNLTRKGTEVVIKEVDLRTELDLYEVSMKIGDSETKAFLSKDGKNFIKEAMSLQEIQAKRVAQEEAAAKEAERRKNIKVPQQKKPEVEIFVMSYCPFGTQVQKGFLPVLELLGEQADISFKFVDYLMHGKRELDENLNQYCIAQEAKEKYLPYLQCFLGSAGETGDAQRCIKEVGISEKKLKDCVLRTDQEFAISESFQDKTAWRGGKYPLFKLHQTANKKYQVVGSPTVVVNGVTVEPNRDPNSLLKAVCSGFEEAPQECKQTLTQKAPSPGFGADKAAAPSSSGGCVE